MALKTSDLEAVLSCHSCHTKLDNMKIPQGKYDEIFDNARGRTHKYWKYKGYL